MRFVFQSTGTKNGNIEAHFTGLEDLFAIDAGTPPLVKVADRAYRMFALSESGECTAALTYHSGDATTAQWLFCDISPTRKAKDLVLFISDGMRTDMITAARLTGHQSLNDRYQSTMQIDQLPIADHQMVHSQNSYITDSANSATALYSGQT